MNCLSKSESGLALLLDHVSQRLQGTQSARVIAHIKSCETCRQRVNGQAKVWTLLDVFEAASVSPQFNRKLYARIAQDEKWNPWRQFVVLLNGWVAKPAMPLAVFSLLLIAGFFLERPQVSTTANPAVVEAPAVVSQTDADQLNVALDDLQLLQQLEMVKDEAPNASKHF